MVVENPAQHGDGAGPDRLEQELMLCDDLVQFTVSRRELIDESTVSW